MVSSKFKIQNMLTKTAMTVLVVGKLIIHDIYSYIYTNCVNFNLNTDFVIKC